MTVQDQDHRQFVAGLSRRQKQALTRRSNFKGFGQLAAHWGAILVIGGLIAAKPIFWPILMPLQGVLIVFLFTTLHESIHRTAFESQWLNDAVARVCGFLILLPPDWFRYFHFAHHRHTQDPQNDPELIQPKPETPLQYAIHISGLPVWYSHLKTLVRNASGLKPGAFVPSSAQARIRREARMMLCLYGLVLLMAIWFQYPDLLYVWVLPAIIGQPFLRFYLLAEHGRCALVSNMFANSRTTYTNAIVRRLAWNMPFHAEHHAFPAVPFHQLPQLHALSKQHLQETEQGYGRFHGKYVRSLKT